MIRYGAQVYRFKSSMTIPHSFRTQKKLGMKRMSFFVCVKQCQNKMLIDVVDDDDDDNSDDNNVHLGALARILQRNTRGRMCMRVYRVSV